MSGMRIYKTFIIPSGLFAAVPIVKTSKINEEPVSSDGQKRLVRPSELPIYSIEKTSIQETQCTRAEPGVLEQSFGSVRKSVQDFVKQFTGYTDVIKSTIDTGRAHSQVTLDYLREETNLLPRIGAVGVGGLSGLILGLRGGKLKKFIYSSTGALVVASICYPKQAQEGMTLAKYYINVGYNFLYGVKPGDANQLEISWPELPKVPSNFSELTDLAGSAAGSAVSAAGSLVSKAAQTFTNLIEDPAPPDQKPKKE